MSSPRALVLGSASRLPAYHFTPFFRSLRAVGFEGTICLFASRLDPGERETLRPLVDEVVDVDGCYEPAAPAWSVRLLDWSKHQRGLRKHYPALCRRVGRAVGSAPGNAVAADLEFRLEGLQSLRYSHYLAYLEAHHEFEAVMISDVRDVIFQRDPFVGGVEEIEVFLEEPHVTFAAGGFNPRWVEDLYGAGAVAALQDRTVSCSGVTVGTREGMIGYLGKMVEEVRRHVPPLGAHDQAMHNWLVYTGALGSPTIVPNGRGRVLTMGALTQVDATTDGVVLNSDGSVPAVLHQYDRHVELAHALLTAIP
ncbi:MAG TPA: hypothetical protein VEP49_00945 [Acidimicrobiia bacterium]|nr:hypothetical protein [Acidimicrobiia bacterium]